MSCPNCHVELGRNGKCPALCQPVEQPPPVYSGPMVVGKTHLGRMSQPLTGWIGGVPSGIRQ